MKNNKLKKILAGGACLGLLVSGGLTLSGCSLTNEQQNALDHLTANTERLVDDFGSYLDGQNAKIDKEKAVEIIEISRLNFIMSNFEELEMVASIQTYDGFEDKLIMQNTTGMQHRTLNGVKVAGTYTDGEMVYVQKSDFNKELHYIYMSDDTFMEQGYYSSGMWIMAQYDMLTQIPQLKSVGEFKEEDIFNIKSIDNGYEFNIVKSMTNVVETDVSEYDTEDEIKLDYLIMDIQIQNGYITKINFKGVQVVTTINNLQTDSSNTKIELDKKGMPIVLSYGMTDVMTTLINVEYKYDNINFSLLDAKIAEIEERFITE